MLRQSTKAKLAACVPLVGIVGTVALVESASPADAHHRGYCGHGTSPDGFHGAYRWRSVFISHYDRTANIHVHKYQEQALLTAPSGQQYWANGDTYEWTCTT